MFVLSFRLLLDIFLAEGCCCNRSLGLFGFYSSDCLWIEPHLGHWEVKSFLFLYLCAGVEQPAQRNPRPSRFSVFVLAVNKQEITELIFVLPWKIAMRAFKETEFISSGFHYVFSLACFHSLDKLIISCHVLVRDVKMAFVAVQTLAALGGQRSPSNASDPGARIEWSAARGLWKALSFPEEGEGGSICADKENTKQRSNEQAFRRGSLLTHHESR